jgi:ceramide glucosyltransferase
MFVAYFRYSLLAVATFPFIYYLIAVYCSWRFFRQAPACKAPALATADSFLPPVSILKPIRGLDPDAYENFASFCQQNYPNYELVFCVDGRTDPVLPILDELRRNFPGCHIRVLYGSGRTAANDKVAKLARLVAEAQHEVVVINDSDVRVDRDYLRTIVAPLASKTVGAVTCFYVPILETGIVDYIQAIGMFSDFYAGILVAKYLDGIKFALGPAIATTRTHLSRFGGYEAIENQPADDMLVGRLIDEQGYEVVLLPYAVATVADYHSLSDLFHKRLRWMVVMRHMRPWGHLGLIFTLGLAWSVAAIALHPSATVAGAYLGAYLLLRTLMTWLIGVHGLKQPSLWKKLPLIPVWDAMACGIWLLSFARNTIRWRNSEYSIRNGKLVPVDGKGVRLEDVPQTK